jgi:hypothetical protein
MFSTHDSIKQPNELWKLPILGSVRRGARRACVVTVWKEDFIVDGF